MTNNKYYQKTLQDGRAKMSEYSVAICSTVRNCGNQLKKNIPKIEALRKYFRDSIVVIVENDSVDNTKNVLQYWLNSYENVHILSEDTQEITIPPKQNEINPFYSKYRIERMAKYRNKYLDYLNEIEAKIDYAIIIDLDIKKIPIEGIINSYGQPNQWDAIVSNGKKFLFKKLRWVFHDTYAHIEIGEANPQTEDKITCNRYRWNFLKKRMPLIPVKSGFNGLALYKYEAIEGCRYNCMPNQDKNVEVYCEHVSLHFAMINKGFTNIFINPSQVVYYQENLWKNFKELWK